MSEYDWRDDPTSHDWQEPCGSQEGTDCCWLCGRSRDQHTGAPQ